MQLFNLTSLYGVSGLGSVNESTVRYYGSLTPEEGILIKTRKVEFSLGYHLPDNAASIPVLNGINSHLFKPKFYARKSEDTIGCIVPNLEVFAHTCRSLAVLKGHFSPEDILASIYVPKGYQLIPKLDWDITRKILFCWKESFLKFLKIWWLMSEGVSLDLIVALAHQLENRLKSPSLELIDSINKKIFSLHGISIDDFYEVFKIQESKSDTDCVSGINLTINDRELSVIQLGWGIPHSKELTQAVMNLRSDVTQIANVGGVGFLGSKGVSLDDVVIPSSCIYLSDNQAPTEKKINSSVTEEIFNNCLFSNPIHKDLSIFSVTPDLGVISNTGTIKQMGLAPDAIDMEISGILSVLEKYPSVKHAAFHYVMDLPSLGYSLGDTYYHRPYLEKLFKTFSRGKYRCFELAIHYLTNDY